VIDVQGRRVRTLVAEDQLAGAHSAFWDGRNERGSMAASGVYYVRLMGPDGTSEARRLLLTR
jgi:flagellar hook assembly protein FlgD